MASGRPLSPSKSTLLKELIWLIWIHTAQMCAGHRWRFPCEFNSICQDLPEGEAIERLWLIAISCNRESTVTVKIQYLVFVGRNVRVSSRRCGLTQLGRWPLASSPGSHSSALKLSHFPLSRSPPPDCSFTTFHPPSQTCREIRHVSLSHAPPPQPPPRPTPPPRPRSVQSRLAKLRFVWALVRTPENTSNCNCSSSFIVPPKKFNLEPLFL